MTLSYQISMKKRTEVSLINQAIIECKQCGTVGYKGETFCVCCGSSMNTEITNRQCPHCFEEIAHSVANYCPHCGTGLNQKVIPPNAI